MGLEDVKVTPVEGAIPGVEVHAQILEMILNQSFLTRPYWALVTEVVNLFILGLLLIVFVPTLRPRLSIGLASLHGPGNDWRLLVWISDTRNIT